MRKLYCVVSLILCYSNLGLLDEPGVKVRITKSGLTFGANKGIDLLAKNIQTLSIPDVSTSSYGISNIKLTRFQKPSANVVPVAGSGLTVALNNAAMDFSMKWRYKIGSGIFTIRDSGSGTVKTKSISINMGFNIAKDADGKPTVSAATCSCSISGFNIKANGGGLITMLYNWLVGLFENGIKKTIQNVVCDNIKKVINENGQSQLATLNTVVPIDSLIFLDYKLTSNPIFTADYMETSHVGQFFTSETEFTQPDQPQIIILDSSKMVSMGLSEQVFNSGTYAFYSLGRLSQIFPIGTEFSEYFNRSSDTELQFVIEASEAPFVSIKENSFSINTTADIQIQSYDGETILVAKILLLLTCNIYFEANHIKGQVLDIQLQFLESSGDFFEIDDPVPTKLLNEILQMLKNILNIGGYIGFPIPSLSNLNFVNSVLESKNGYEKLGTDLTSS